MKKMILFIGMIVYQCMSYGGGKVFQVLNNSNVSVDVEVNASKQGREFGGKYCEGSITKKATINPNAIGKFGLDEAENEYCHVRLDKITASTAGGMRSEYGEKGTGTRTDMKYFIINQITATQKDVNAVTKFNADLQGQQGNKTSIGMAFADARTYKDPITLGQILSVSLTPVSSKDFNDAVKKLEKQKGTKKLEKQKGSKVK